MGELAKNGDRNGISSLYDRKATFILPSRKLGFHLSLLVFNLHRHDPKLLRAGIE
jgi:hypothetical protein